MDNYTKQKNKLAATFRWAAKLNMHESVVNHFSLSLQDNQSKFIVNPGGIHFSLIKASDLIIVDNNNIEESIKHLPEDKKPLRTALDLHGSIHNEVKNANCILHVHSKYATIVSTFRNKKEKKAKWSGCLPPIDQNTMRFYRRVAVDDNYNGMAKDGEAKRLAKKIADKNILLLGNHGVIVVGFTVEKAFDDLYYFERACETYVTALTTGKDLEILSNSIAEKTATQWENYKPSNIADLHFNSLIAILDKENSDYKE